MSEIKIKIKYKSGQHLNFEATFFLYCFHSGMDEIKTFILTMMLKLMMMILYIRNIDEFLTKYEIKWEYHSFDCMFRWKIFTSSCALISFWLWQLLFTSTCCVTNCFDIIFRWSFCVFLEFNEFLGIWKVKFCRCMSLHSSANHYVLLLHRVNIHKTLHSIGNDHYYNDKRLICF